MHCRADNTGGSAAFRRNQTLRGGRALFRGNGRLVCFRPLIGRVGYQSYLPPLILRKPCEICQCRQKGAMLALDTSIEEVEELCRLESFEGRIQVAACNSLSSVTLSGDEDVVIQLLSLVMLRIALPCEPASTISREPCPGLQLWQMVPWFSVTPCSTI
ncbi:hypothetical protein F5Y07DRAFT_166887 [Xylaria sp. FL0933]|nr:hypothetical protein F5Y07DRAFT_166887 [Xylaria sp. FL0933]